MNPPSKLCAAVIQLRGQRLEKTRPKADAKAQSQAMGRAFLCFWFTLCAVQAMGDATIRLNNKDAQMPIFLRHVGTLATPADQIYIQVLAGPAGGTLIAVTPIGATTSVIELSEPGYFDAGVGIIPGIGDGKVVDCRIQLWQPLPDWTGLPRYEAGTSQWITKWTQRSGSWDPQSGLAPTGPVLAIPLSPIVGAVPEPSTVALGILGGAALITNSVMKSSKPKK